MRRSSFMSLVGAASMALALLVGCGDDDVKPASSQAGQSCVRTADCASGLSCIANVCYKTAPQTGGDAGDGSTTPVGPVLGGEGESCTSRKDCTDGLSCFNNRCTDTASSGEGGAPATTPGNDLGTRGESCRVNGDCSKGLVCVPDASFSGTGICDVADFGITPTGLKCTGECVTAADCCQLPIALHVGAIQSCQDIDDSITTNMYDCAAPATPTAKTLCFEKATYCNCGAKTWSCSDQNTCVYGTACVVAAGLDVPTGCPSYSRLNPIATALSGLTCNPDTKKCVGATAPAGCAKDADCVGGQIADGIAGDVCSKDECTCYAGDKQCYRKCSRDIDCATGKKCDDKSSLCVPDDECVSDAQCAYRAGNLASKCNKDSGKCGLSCVVDRDCTGTGLNGTVYTGMVCGADGFCASVANECVKDTQCPATLGALKKFCVETVTAGGTTVSSSITD